MELLDHSRQLTRRTFLGHASRGLGAVAFASLLNPEVLRAEEKWRGVVHPRHLAPRAKRVIWLCMAGGPSHLETLDFKPTLRAQHEQPIAASARHRSQTACLQISGPRFPPHRSARAGWEKNLV